MMSLHHSDIFLGGLTLLLDTDTINNMSVSRQRDSSDGAWVEDSILGVGDCCATSTIFGYSTRVKLVK